MHSSSKAKAKLQLQRSINQLGNVLPMNSNSRNKIQQSLQQSGQRIQKIHETLLDSEHKQLFLVTQFNLNRKLKTSFPLYRSPYTNKYYSPINQSIQLDYNDLSYPSPILLDLQQKGNILYREYGRLYYGDGAITNFFVYQSQQGLNLIFVLRNDINDQDIKGTISTTNLCQIRGDPAKTISYKLISTINYFLNISFNQLSNDFVTLSGTLKKNRVESKKITQQYEIDEFHLTVCGKLMQQTQNLLRQQLQSVFLSKSKQITQKSRFIESRAGEDKRVEMAKQLTKMRSQTKKVISGVQ